MPIKPYKHLRLMEAHREVIDELLYEDPSGKLQFAHAALSQVAMPYRSVGQSYTRTSGPWSLGLTINPVLVRAGENGFLREDTAEVPYGPRCRLVLLALQTRAVQTKSPSVSVEPSFTAFARILGLGTDGRSLRSLRAQMINLSMANVALSYRKKEKLSIYQGNIFSELHVNLQADENQRPIWPDEVRFSNDYYESLIQHALPVRSEAIHALRSSARALDFYVFLAYRLRSLRKPTMIPWRALRTQFSDNQNGNIDTFKRQMVKTVADVVTVYPSAKIEKVRGGLKLFPSLSPVKSN